MSHALMNTTKAHIITDDESKQEFWLHVEATPGSESLVWLICAINGVECGSPIRLKPAGNRIAADFPTVSDACFIVDGNGHITNG